MQFSDPIASGLFLVREALRSPNYVPGGSGWTVNQDGSAEFNDILIRGDFRTGPPAPYVQILNGSASVDFIPAANPNVTSPGQIQGGVDVLELFSPSLNNNDRGKLTLASGNQLAANPINRPFVITGNKANLVSNGQLWSNIGDLVSGLAFDTTSRSTASTVFAGIAGQTTQLTTEWPVSNRYLLLMWALCNNATAGANCIVSTETRDGSLAGTLLAGSTDLFSVRTNSTGNFAGMGFRYLDLAAQPILSGTLYHRLMFRVSAGTGNFVQSAIACIALP